VIRDNGACLKELIEEMRAELGALAASPEKNLNIIGEHLATGMTAVEDVCNWISDYSGNNPDTIGVGAKYFLLLFGNVTAGCLHAKIALQTVDFLGDDLTSESFLSVKILSARYFAGQIMSQFSQLSEIVKNGPESVLAIKKSQF
jgi:hypothetical protein